MASNSNARLINPDGYNLSSSGYNFTTSWADKRSSTDCSISFIVTGSGSPDGYVHVETSNAPENNSISFGSGPYVVPGSTSPLDVVTYPGSTIHVLATGTQRFDIHTAARWVRVVFINNASSGSLPIYCWINCPFESP